MCRFVALAASLAAFLAFGQALAADPAADEATRLLQTSAATYAALRSYRDVGVLIDPEFGDMTFDTAFARPDRFRFRYTVGHPFILLRYVKTTRVLLSDGKRITTSAKILGAEPTERAE